MSMNNITMPGDLDRATRFAGRFTIKDIGRITGPTIAGGLGGYFGLAASTLGGPIGGVAGLGVGAGLYAIKKDGKKLDEYIRHKIRWKALHTTIEESHVHEVNDDHIVTQDGGYVAILYVKPIPQDLLTDAEIADLHDSYVNTLSAAPEHGTFQIHSRQRVLDLENAIDRINQAGNVPDQYREAYRNRLRSYTENQITVTDHFIVLRVDGERDDAASTLNRYCQTIRKPANGAVFDVVRVTGADLTAFADRFNQQQPGVTPRHLQMNGEHRRAVYITQFPEEVPFGWPVQLLQEDATIDVIQTVAPQNTSDIIDQLNKVERARDFEVTHWLEHGLPGAEELERLIEDARAMRRRLKLEDATAHRVGYVLIARGHTKAECDTAFDMLTDWLDRKGIEYQEPVYQTHDAFATASPFHPDRLDETLLMPDTSAGASFPFGTQHVEDVSGVLYGTADRGRTPLFIDRFSHDSPHAIRIGRTGAGKTVATQLEILRSALVYDDIQILIVSPKADDQAYEQLTKALDGTVVSVQTNERPDIPDDDVVCLQFASMAHRDRVESLRHLVDKLHQCTQNDRQTLAIVDESHHLLRDQEGCELLSAWVRESRSSHTAVTILTQSAGDFAENDEGERLLDNVGSVWFMRHEEHQKRSNRVQELFGLSAQETQDISKLATGGEFGSEAIIRSPEQADTRVRIRPTEVELAYLDALETADEAPEADILPAGFGSTRMDPAGGYAKMLQTGTLETEANPGRKTAGLPKNLNPPQPRIPELPTLPTVPLPSIARQLKSIYDKSGTAQQRLGHWVMLTGSAILAALQLPSLDDIPEPEEMEFEGYPDRLGWSGWEYTESRPEDEARLHDWKLSTASIDAALSEWDLDYALQIGEHGIGLRLKTDETVQEREAVNLLADACGVPRRYVRNNLQRRGHQCH